jgi:hypothetical protein
MRIIIGLLVMVVIPAAAVGDFVSMEEGARATALGGAFAAVADDATAVLWNPAGMAHTDGLKLAGMRTRLFSVSGLTEDCLAVGYGGWHRMGLGFGWTRTGLEDVYNEDAFVIGAARRMGRRLALGGALRIYRVSAPGYEYYNDPNFEDGDQGYAFDLGLLYRSRKWTLGLVWRNLGEPELKLIDTTEDPDPIRSEFRVAGTYTIREVMLVSGEIRRAADVPGYVEDKLSYHLGTEIWFYNAFALRAGLHDDRATAGLGLKIQRLTVDAALMSHRRPGNKYRLSVSFDY